MLKVHFVVRETFSFIIIDGLNSLEMCKFPSFYTRYKSFEARNKFYTQKASRSAFAPDSNIFAQNRTIKELRVINTKIYI